MTEGTDSAAWRQDLVASIVVFLVALPLCMGIAIASGAPPAAGLITGIVGGLIVALMAGSPLQVSGPAAGLAVIVWELIQSHGMATLGVIVLLAGVIQLIAGAARLGQWFRAVSPAVIQGMLAGIGILIFASQFHVMVDDSPRGSGLMNLATIPVAIWKGIFPLDGSVHHQAAAIGLLTIVSIVLWQLFSPRKLKVIPAPLVAVIIATIAASAFGLEIRRIDVPSNLLSAVTLPGFDVLGSIDGSIILAALAMALVASAETLLCATAVDQLHSGPRTKYDKELAAQGVGNMICGFLGALPMTGVIVRSSANVEAGGKTRLSAFLHGVWLLVFVAALPFVLRMIPTACLAALLVYTGYRLVNVAAIKKLATYGRGELGIYAATVIGVVTIDLLSGVLIGVGLALVKLLYTFSHLTIRTETSPDGGRTTLHLEGAATMLALPKLAKALEEVPGSTELHARIDQLDYIDHACLNLLMDWERQHQATGGQLVVDWEELTGRFRPPAQRMSSARATDGDIGERGFDANAEQQLTAVSSS